MHERGGWLLVHERAERESEGSYRAFAGFKPWAASKHAAKSMHPAHGRLEGAGRRQNFVAVRHTGRACHIMGLAFAQGLHRVWRAAKDCYRAVLLTWACAGSRCKPALWLQHTSSFVSWCTAALRACALAAA